MKWTALSLVVLLAPALQALAQVQTEDEIFGGQAPEEKKEEKGKEAEVSKPSASAEALMDKLQIGGRLEIRSSSSKVEDQRFAKGPYNQNKTADIYFDTRPNNDVRVFFRTRFYEANTRTSEDGSNPPTADTPSPTDTRGVEVISQSIDELWFKWDIEDTLFVTAGKQHVKWGRGRFWNPTDFTAQTPKDPFALFDRRLGQELLKLHLPFEKEGHNLYAIFQFDDAQRNDDIGVALRGEFAFGSSGEAALTFQNRRGSPLRLGADLGTGLGSFDLNLEAAFSKRNPRTFYKGDFDVDTLTYPEPYQKRDKWYSQYVANLEYAFKYNDDDSIMMGVEGFWNELGYEDRLLEFYSLVNGQSQILYSGKRYVGAYVNLPMPGSWNETNFYLNGIQNLSDGTALLRMTGTWTLYKQITLEAYVSGCFGKYGELCFKVPDEIVNSPNYLQLPEETRVVIGALPRKYTTFVTGVALSMLF